jgi:hypothetical protein
MIFCFRKEIGESIRFDKILSFTDTWVISQKALTLSGLPGRIWHGFSSFVIFK